MVCGVGFVRYFGTYIWFLDKIYLTLHHPIKGLFSYSIQ